MHEWTNEWIYKQGLFNSRFLFFPRNDFLWKSTHFCIYEVLQRIISFHKKAFSFFLTVTKVEYVCIYIDHTGWQIPFFTEKYGYNYKIKHFWSLLCKVKMNLYFWKKGEKVSVKVLAWRVSWTRTLRHSNPVSYCLIMEACWRLNLMYANIGKCRKRCKVVKRILTLPTWGKKCFCWS